MQHIFIIIDNLHKCKFQYVEQIPNQKSMITRIWGNYEISSYLFLIAHNYNRNEKTWNISPFWQETALRMVFRSAVFIVLWLQFLFVRKFSKTESYICSWRYQTWCCLCAHTLMYPIYRRPPWQVSPSCLVRGTHLTTPWRWLRRPPIAIYFITLTNRNISSGPSSGAWSWQSGASWSGWKYSHQNWSIWKPHLLT